MTDANVTRAREIMAFLARHARHVAICPGSRSTPLALAAESHPDLTTHIILDERAAGFFALGVARATGRPGVVITTSGTAVANLLPAMVEGHQAAVPWIALTADRPPRLRNTGANQTIDQRGIFGVHATEIQLELPPAPLPDALEAAMDAGQPVHINAPFEEPLAPSDPAAYDGQDPVERVSRPGAAGQGNFEPTGRGLIIVGPGPAAPRAAAAIEREAARLGAPILADPLSGVTGIGSYDAILTDPPASLSPDWILQIGHTPVSKSLGKWLLAHDGIRTRIDPTGRRWDEGTPAWLDGEPAAVLAGIPPATPWAAWRQADTAAREVLAEVAASNGEARIVHDVAPLAETLFIGNSLAVRELDRFVERTGRAIHGNRGASGIDGNLATAAGMSVAGPVTAIVGELTFQHDIGSLALLRDHDVRVVVIENGGGGIFRHLPVAKATDDFERLFLTPPHLDPVAAAQAFGLTATEATVGSLLHALRDHRIVSVAVDGTASAAWRTEVTRRAAQAATAAVEAVAQQA